MKQTAWVWAAAVVLAACETTGGTSGTADAANGDDTGALTDVATDSDAAVADGTPVDAWTAPDGAVDGLATDAAPGDAAPSDAAPGDGATTDAASVDAAPADASPADSAADGQAGDDAGKDSVADQVSTPDIQADVPVPTSCGGFAGKPCAPGEFCDPESCGADVMGSCVPAPNGCPKNLAPVCGCDGQTYDNDCFRQIAGVGKASEGKCPASDACVVGDNTTCPLGQFCQSPNAGTCDGKGTCAPVPQICPMVFLPVCGCDGKDYGNSCEANASGTNVASNGECGPQNCNTTADCPKPLACKAGVCGECPGMMCTAQACPAGEVKDQCCQCYTP